jgi:poly-gamma-glutamate synthesis protein (capsule biosynthesis protein)
MMTGKPLNHGQSDQLITVCMCGDVMTGRGVDQILPHPSDPTLHEPYMRSALGYVALAEQASGPISKPVDFAYIWGDVLAELQRVGPAVQIANLETAITTSDDYWQGKGINYRMHPANLPCLTIAGLDCCSLANNHVLDWGYRGLQETIAQLKSVNIHTAGAGQNAEEAAAPATIAVPGGGRVLVFAFGTPTSGIPFSWAAAANQPGVNLVRSLSEATVQLLGDQVRRIKQPRDIAIASIHWGSNWGYAIPRSHTAFAHQLIDDAGIDIVHGHSSHHVRAIEVYRDRLILYGCGDFLNDYEGIHGHEQFRPDLGLLYMASLDPASGRLIHLQMIPTWVRRMRVQRATPTDTQWLRDRLNRAGQRFGTRVQLHQDNSLTLQWKINPPMTKPSLI